ncbi:MAG: PEGA domain-containing protein [Coriobacteriales bacterium]|nr:PEGA domain-containing protein [Coriobacteriales bacterium]
MEAGNYTITVKASGYQPMAKEVQLNESLNVGDFAMQR